MKYAKPVTEIRTFVKCDFCVNTTEEGTVWMDICAICGKHICNHHDHFVKGETTIEDGCLCPNCGNVYKFDCPVDGGIGVINRKTGEIVEACYI